MFLLLLLALFSQYCVYDDNTYHHYHCHVFLSLNYAALKKMIILITIMTITFFCH